MFPVEMSLCNLYGRSLQCEQVRGAAVAPLGQKCSRVFSSGSSVRWEEIREAGKRAMLMLL